MRGEDFQVWIVQPKSLRADRSRSDSATRRRRRGQFEMARSSTLRLSTIRLAPASASPKFLPSKSVLVRLILGGRLFVSQLATD
jgi:hypothetical protein